MLCSCGTNKSGVSSNDPNAPIETEKVKRYEFDLSLDNYWYFIDVTSENTSTHNAGYIDYSFKGVLSYAYYENVSFVIDYRIHGEGGIYHPSGDYQADIIMKLNASGSGVFYLKYDFIPDNFTPSFTGDSVSDYQRSSSIKSVSGKVIFSF